MGETTIMTKPSFNHHARLCLTLLTACAFYILFSSNTQAEPIQWKKHTINADSRFEIAGIGDINGDGKPDIISGSHWYEGPSWKKHFIGKIEESNNYFNDFSNYPQDVDGDGDLDIVSVTWFSKEAFWKENPGASGGEWPYHTIDKPGNIETALFYDINGDGLVDIVPNVSGEVSWYEKRPAGSKGKFWTRRFVSKVGAGHGVGAGDVDGDGKLDLLTPNGWYSLKKEGGDYAYTWHPEFKLGQASVPILVHDVNRDGLNDIVWGMGHNYGVLWLEQGKKDGKRTWTQHTIDKSWSQAHYLEILDLNKDGTDELVTGKRFHAHNGNDPGGNEPCCIYIYTYDLKKKSWTRHVVDEGTKAGFGLIAAIGDVDDDGDPDLVCPGKSGLYLFEQQNR